MAAKRTHRKRSHKRTNPVVRHKAKRVYHVFSNKKRGRHRRRRNPDTIGSTGLTVKKIGWGVGGAVAGGLSYEVVNGLFQPEGNGKYLIAIGNALAGWWLISKINSLAGITYAAGVIAMAAKDYAQESGILQGIQGMLGQVYDTSGFDTFIDPRDDYRVLGAVPQGNGLSAVPQEAYGSTTDRYS